MADIQVCPFHLKGHCKNKTKCALSHAISDCNMGSLCKDKKLANFAMLEYVVSTQSAILKNAPITTLLFLPLPYLPFFPTTPSTLTPGFSLFFQTPPWTAEGSKT